MHHTPLVQKEVLQNHWHANKQRHRNSIHPGFGRQFIDGGWGWFAGTHVEGGASEWVVQHVLFPAMRLFLQPPAKFATDGTILQVQRFVGANRTK
jgi:hypothetical protein